MRAGAPGSVLACRRACGLYINRWICTDYTDTSHLLRRPTLHTPAPVHSQNSARMSDNPVKEEVEKFNRRSLKKADTKITNVLPTQEQIDEEKKAQKEQK